MKKRRIVGLLVALLAIPAIALAVAQAILAYGSNQFQQGAAADFAEIKNPTPDQQKAYYLFRKLSLQQFCSNPSFRTASELESVSSEEADPPVTITTGAGIAGIVGVGLILAIAMFALLARSVNIAEDSDWSSDADPAEFIELLTTEQMRNYAFSNPDLENAFIRVLEALDASGEMNRLAADFVTEVARIAHRPRPKSLREGIDLLKELSLEARRDPKLIGNLLLAEWLTGKFLSDAAELSGELNPEISELAKEWLRLWWLYLFRARVAMTYGNDVMSKMMDHVRKNLRKLAELDLDHNFRGLSEKIDTVVAGLDGVILKFKDAPVLTGKGKAPEEYIAASFFLVLDLESPYYRKSRIDEDVVTEVSLTFVTMRARVTEWIDSVI